jgi:hypothetical protein
MPKNTSITKKLLINVAILMASIMFIEGLNLMGVGGGDVGKTHHAKFDIMGVVLFVVMLAIQWEAGAQFLSAFGFAYISGHYWEVTFLGKVGNNLVGESILLIFIGVLWDYFS